MEFQNSETKVNLMRAFAGESQARNRYTFAAEVAEQNNQYHIAQVFLFTANQERAHAKVFYDHLEQLSGENIALDGTYPVNISDQVRDLLDWAVHNEMEEYEQAYPDFAMTAEQEGFPQIAASFRQIAEIEHAHAKRFQYIIQQADKMTTGQTTAEQWMCLNCGHIHGGMQLPGQCPVCQHDKG
ncbi:MAG: rubrerythrin family protein, partial [Peptococcaceae bacterium]|nr:rubrerythrin family protein [Peptococcaceae bacterium]